MNESTSTPSLGPYLAWLPNTIFKSTLITIGLVALLANATLATAIIRAKLWRKAHIYVYYLALFFADSFASLGVVAVSISSIYTRGLVDVRLTRLDCTAVNLPFFYGNLLCTSALLSISIDRFIAVGSPMSYRANYKRIQRTLLTIALGASTAVALTGFIGLRPFDSVPFCGLGMGMTDMFSHAYVPVHWAASVLVVTLYAVSIVALKCYQRGRRTLRALPSDRTVGEQHFTKSATLLVATEFCTTTLGLSVMVLAFVVEKRTVGPEHRGTPLYIWIGHGCLIFVQLNTLLSPAVLVCQHRRLRKVVKQLCFDESDNA